MSLQSLADDITGPLGNGAPVLLQLNPFASTGQVTWTITWKCEEQKVAKIAQIITELSTE